MRASAAITQQFFATVQNKLHFAIHGHTAPELIIKRAHSEKERMGLTRISHTFSDSSHTLHAYLASQTGEAVLLEHCPRPFKRQSRSAERRSVQKKCEKSGLTTWKNAPHGKILKSDVSIAKNYLNEKELRSLDRFITMYLDYAETQAERNVPMTMNDWADKLNAFLQFNEKDILQNPGKVSHEIAKTFAESEFEKYRIIQDHLFKSDFDRHLINALQNTDIEEVVAVLEEKIEVDS
jgi:hypothetical protein